MALRAEYLTKVSDYDLTTKQEVFYVLSRQKWNSEIMSEKIRIPVAYQIGKEIPLDSKTSWRISPYKN